MRKCLKFLSRIGMRPNKGTGQNKLQAMLQSLHRFSSVAIACILPRTRSGSAATLALFFENYRRIPRRLQCRRDRSFRGYLRSFNPDGLTELCAWSRKHLVILAHLHADRERALLSFPLPHRRGLLMGCLLEYLSSLERFYKFQLRGIPRRAPTPDDRG